LNLLENVLHDEWIFTDTYGQVWRIRPLYQRSCPLEITLMEKETNTLLTAHQYISHEDRNVRDLAILTTSIFGVTKP